MSGNTCHRRGGTVRALAWICAVLGAAVLVTVVLATRGGDIQKQLGEAGQRLKEKIPGLPELPGRAGLPPGSDAPAPDPARGDAQPAPPGGTPELQPAPVPDARPGSGGPAAGAAGPAGTPGPPPARSPASTAPAPRPYTVSDPPPVAKTRHKVTRGETLYTLAETYYEDGSLWKLLADANGIKDPSELREGMELTIPGR